MKKNLFKLAAFAMLWVSLSANATLVTLQPDGVAGKDASINDQTLSGQNMGSWQHMTENWVTENQSGLIQFDISAYLGQSVSSAVLKLYADWNANAGQVYTVSKNLGDWAENTVTYNNAPTYGPALDTIITTNGSQFYSFDVTSAVNDWLAGETNYGFRINETNGKVYFASSDNANASLRPILEFNTSLAPTQIPEPASLALVGLALAGLGVSRRRQQQA